MFENITLQSPGEHPKENKAFFSGCESYEQQMKDIENIRSRTDLTIEEKLIEADKLGIPLDRMRKSLSEAGGINMDYIPDGVLRHEDDDNIAA